MSKGCILVTGGAGFIGSHTVIEIVNSGYTPVVVDNFVNSNIESIRRVEEILGQKIILYSLDVADKNALSEVFEKHTFDAVIHFAGLKAVGESIKLPLLYYKNNLGCTLNLLEVMKEHEVHNLVFSSSATVYGTPDYLPLDEKHPVGQCTNAYGKTKYFIEEILADLAIAEPDWNVIVLRYFNPVGAHKSGRIGEDPNGPPNNLMPYVSQVAVGRRNELSVFGGDYETPDGTGVRDYIHVVDLAKGHVTSLKKLNEACGYKVYNLGTGNGYSVLDMVRGMEKASGKAVPYSIVGRREGDVASVYANPSLSASELGWTADMGMDQMCEDIWRWQSNNPFGYVHKKED